MTAARTRPCPGCGEAAGPAYNQGQHCWTCYERQAATNGNGAAMNGHDRGNGRRVLLTRASEVPPERVRWLWKERIALRSLVVIAGEPGLGKSTFTNAHLAAQITRGTLDGELHGQPRDVVVATAEDDWASVVVPRLMAAGADLERVHRLQVRHEDGTSLLTLPDDVDLLETECRRLREHGRPVGLVVVDPIGAFLSEQTDSHKNASVRRALAPLAELADREQTAVAAVGHLNKNEAQKLVARISGSGAFGEAARSVLAFARHPEDPDGDKGLERVIVHAKSNWGRYAPTLACRIESRIVDLPGGDRADVGFLVITGETDIGPEDLVSDRGGGNDRAELTEAMEWLEDELADDEWHESRPVKEAARAAGITPRTLQRACEELHVEYTREGLGRGRSAWRLPHGDLTPTPLARDRGARSEQPPNDAVEPNSPTDTRSRAISPDVARDRERSDGAADQLVVPLDVRDVPAEQIEAFVAGCVETFGATHELVREEPAL
jgi:hypothetical protein